MQKKLQEGLKKGLICETAYAEFHVTREAPERTHETAVAAGSFLSKDELVKAPVGVLWYGDGPDHGF